MSNGNPSLKRIAKAMVGAEVDKDESNEMVTAQWWADLVKLILDDLPPATEPRISGLVIDYILGEEDGTG